jgi:8-oxo-dGTP pyrophosphatase MutT (NUDIX family)
MLVQQFRAPILFAHRQDHTLEAIAGIEEEADPQATARREGMEEAGLALQTLEHVATVSTMPGISTERMTLYLAPYGSTDRVGSGGGLAAEHENITVIEMPIADLDVLMGSGRLVDLKTLALAQALKLRHPALFR